MAPTRPAPVSQNLWLVKNPTVQHAALFCALPRQSWRMLVSNKVGLEPSTSPASPSEEKAEPGLGWVSVLPWVLWEACELAAGTVRVGLPCARCCTARHHIPLFRGTHPSPSSLPSWPWAACSRG